MKQQPRVYIVDDDTCLCDSLKIVVESVGLVGRIFFRAKDFLQSYDQDQPGCLVLDIRIPEISGPQLFEILRQKNLQIPTIFLTGYGTVAMAVELMKMGAFDFLEKPVADQILLERIQQAILFDRLERKQREQVDELSTRLAKLSRREHEILDGIIAGKNNKVIALDLKISPKTVEFHRTNIMRKLNAETLVDLTKIVLAQPSLSMTHVSQIS
jgi:FixJ family two-component response regulator